MSSPYLTVEEAAELFKFSSRHALYKFLARHPDAPGVRRIGSRVLIHRDEFGTPAAPRYDLPKLRRRA